MELPNLETATRDELIDLIAKINKNKHKCTDAQKRASYKWIANNREKHNEYSRNAMKKDDYKASKQYRIDNAEKIKEYQRLYRLKKKEEAKSIII